MRNSNRCALEKKINNHNATNKRFKTTLFFCPLHTEKDVSMNRVGIICGACCIRTQMVGEKMADLIMRKTITYEDLERDPMCFVEHLPDDLKNYAKVVSDVSGKDWETIRGECRRCKSLAVEPTEIKDVPAQKMTYVARRDV